MSARAVSNSYIDGNYQLSKSNKLREEYEKFKMLREKEKGLKEELLTMRKELSNSINNNQPVIENLP